MIKTYEQLIKDKNTFEQDLQDSISNQLENNTFIELENPVSALFNDNEDDIIGVYKQSGITYIKFEDGSGDSYGEPLYEVDNDTLMALFVHLVSDFNTYTYYE